MYSVVFWIAKMTIAARLLVYQPSKTNIRNARARFVELIKYLFELFYRITAR